MTKDFPVEPPSGLDAPGAFRVDVRVGRAGVRAVVGDAPDDAAVATGDLADTWIRHPVYGWVAVVDPGERTCERAVELLRAAHAEARARHERGGG